MTSFASSPLAKAADVALISISFFFYAFWFIIDHHLKGVFPLETIINFDLVNSDFFFNALG
ncbi:DUF960 family protein [Lactococcus lactis]|uniref:DUF960 family protein n=1 Tax=Lactococcus lactis TaxID=1358 RepID=UPI0035CAB846